MSVPEANGQHPLTIEELSAETGLSVRNIRSHRARGLLQPPAIRDRVGYYGDDHVARLALISRLQADGFNLAAIKQLIARDPGVAGGVLEAIEQVRQPFETEQAEVVTLEELGERFSAEDVNGVVERAEQLGVLVALGEDRYEVPAPSLLDVAEELAQRGVPLHHALAVVEKVQASSRTVAREFIRLFLDDVFTPFEREGFPADRWDDISAGIERLRPMSAQVVLAMYQLTMSEEVERESARLFERLSQGQKRRRPFRR